MFSLLINLVFYLFNIPIVSIQNAMGLHNLDAVYMVIQAVTSIILAYVGGLLWGMPGIFIGLLIPLVIFTTIRKGVVICKNALGMLPKEYLIFIIFELVKIAFTIFSAVLVCTYITMTPSILSCIVKGFVAVVIGLLMPMILSLKSEENKYALSLVRKYVNRFMKRR